MATYILTSSTLIVKGGGPLADPLGKKISIKIPDYVEPLIAYRAFIWTGQVLRSTNIMNHQYHPGREERAQCMTLYSSCSLRSHTNALYSEGDAPHTEGVCGFYSVKDPDLLAEQALIMDWQPTVRAEVEIWGRVIEHETGYRSQFLKIRKILSIPKHIHRDFRELIYAYETVGDPLIKRGGE